MSGSAGPVEFGVLAAQIDHDRLGGVLERAPRVGVLRVATGLGEHQRLGVIATQGHPEDQSGSSLAGLDYQLLRNDVFGDRTLEGHLWALRSTNAGRGPAYADPWQKEPAAPR